MSNKIAEFKIYNEGTIITVTAHYEGPAPQSPIRYFVERKMRKFYKESVKGWFAENVQWWKRAHFMPHHKDENHEAKEV